MINLVTQVIGTIAIGVSTLIVPTTQPVSAAPAIATTVPSGHAVDAKKHPGGKHHGKHGKGHKRIV